MDPLPLWHLGAGARRLGDRPRLGSLAGKLLPFCDRKDLSLLKHLNVPTPRTFRNSWPYSALSAGLGGRLHAG